MQDQRGPMNSESAGRRSTVMLSLQSAQVLVSAIWLEHRIRRVSARLSTLPSQRASVVSVGSSQTLKNRTVGCSFLTVGATDPLLIKRKVRPMTLYTKVGYGSRLRGRF